MEIIAFIIIITLYVLLFDKLKKVGNSIKEVLNRQDTASKDIDKVLGRLNEIEKLLLERPASLIDASLHKREMHQDQTIEAIEKDIAREIKELDSQLKEKQAEPTLNSIIQAPIPDNPVYESNYKADYQQKVWGEGPRVIKEPQKEKRDFEKFIGENVINKIGIGILVLGVGFFVKYAIDKDWINESFRVLIGIFCGSLLLALAHRMHKSYKAFSSVLMGGGLAVFYLTIAIGFNQYNIFSQLYAFIIMVGITGLAVGLAIMYNRMEISILALIGGFGTPFFVSTGQGDYNVLLTYILILDVGMIILATFRKWPLLNSMAYLFTIIIFGGWFFTYNFNMHPEAYIRALVFASSYYLAFFLMNVTYNIRTLKPFKGLDFLLLLSNSFLYYSLGMYVLYAMELKQGQGVFTAVLMLFHIAIAYFVSNLKKDRNLFYLLIGLGVSFLSLFAPVQLHGSYITAYWAAEAVLMLWLSQKTNISILRTASMITVILSIFSMLYIWNALAMSANAEGFGPIMLNKAFVTGSFLIACLALSRYLLRSSTDIFLPMLSVVDYNKILGVVLFIFLYLVPFLEISNHLSLINGSYQLYFMIMALYNFLFVACWMRYAKYKGNKISELLANIAGYICVFAYIILYLSARNAYMVMLISGMVTTGYTLLFATHLPCVALISAILYFSSRHLMSRASGSPKGLIYCLMAFAIVYIASAELNYWAIYIQRNSGISLWKTRENMSKIAYPVLWGLCAFLFMRSGMLYKNRTMRVIALVLLLITVVKLFVYDIITVSEVGKIIAFICLGILLLVISFMYQKIKKIIFDGGTQPQQNIESGDN